MNIINSNIEQIKFICKSSHVKSLFLFGSHVKDNFNEESDIDLIVEIEDNDPLSYADKYFNLKFKLEKLLGITIDLLESKAIRNSLLKKEINNTKNHVYAEGNKSLVIGYKTSYSGNF